MSAITDDHKRVVWNSRKFLSPLEARRPKSRCGHGIGFSGGSWEPLPASASSRVWWLWRALWQRPCSLCPFFTGLSSGDLSSASYKDTAIRFRSHPDTPG